MSLQLLENHPIADLAIRSFVLLIITAGVAFVCRRRSAAIIHRIWFLGFCGCVAIPIVALLSPGLTLPLSTMSQSNSSKAVISDAENDQTSMTSDVATSRISNPLPIADTPASSPVVWQDSSSIESSTRTISSIPNQPNPLPKATLPIQKEPLSFKAWMALIWCFGTVLIFLRLAKDFLSTQKSLRQCTKIDSEEWCLLRDDVTCQLGIQSNVELRLHPGAVSPMVAGFIRTVVLLPRDAQSWSFERRKQVLLHEFAHIRRRDVLTQLVATLVCAIYWFNPLTWWGAKQMKKLREIACDDVVITHTSDPKNYAQTLLDVAKEYRYRQQICTVAMSRVSNVEDRITAILDSNRLRTSFSRRTARLVGYVALSLTVLIGSLQLQVQANDETASQTGNASAVTNGVEDEIKTMAIRVVDEKGQPIPQADLHVSIWEFDDKRDFPNRDYATNDQGEVEIERPRRLRIMRIWPSKDGYVPLFVNFAKGTHQEGRLIPEEYEFQLQRGHRLSGQVVDESGNPISSAKVQVKAEVNEPAWGVEPKPMISTWLAEGDDAPVTDENGHWEITNAPGRKKGKDFEFRIRVTHPNFAGDQNWGEMQNRQGITTAQLRDGTARLTMQPGTAITGSITGPDGEPVTKGLVIWSDHPYIATGVNETPIDDTGRYETHRLAPGEYPVTVLAPGFAPRQQTIQVSQSLQEVNFQLEPGHPIRIQIVDQLGNAIPNAYVGIGEWRGTEAIYNEKHSNVPESGIPRRANDQGIYTWDWAPADGVQYRISAKGFDQKEVTLVAKPEAHQIQLESPITIFGQVVDAQTGAPVEKFQVIPVKAFRPDFYSTNFQAGSVAEGKNGRFKIEINSHGQTGNRYRVRIEADGYRTAFGQKSLAVGDPPLQESFKLERAPALLGIVQDQHGQLVNNFTVAIGTPTIATDFSLDRLDNSFGRAFQVEGKYEFQLSPTFEPRRIRVFNDDGFAEILRQPNEPIGIIKLQPWASVSGRLVQNGTPISNEWIYFSPTTKRALTDARFQESFSTKTDTNGNFSFDRLPPVQGTVRAYLGPWQDSVLTSSKSVPLDLQPGDHKKVSLGGQGTTLTGRVVATGRSNDDLSKQWSLNYLIRRDQDSSNSKDFKPLEASFLREQDFQSWLATQENYFVKLADDGRMWINGVEPGQYDLVIQLYEQPSGCLVETIGEKIFPVVVTAEQLTADSIELGDLEVECRRGPRVGSDMRAFEFTDADGQVRLVNDTPGRYILFHVWASWCQPCLASMPEVKSTVDQYSSDELIVVGLNVDEETSAAKSLAQTHEWTWAQNYLGSESDMMRQLAVSSVPAYYLIGPDGKLLGSANTWEQINGQLNSELRN